MKVNNIKIIDNFLYIILNDRKLLVNKDIYDVTKYDDIKKVITLNKDVCIVTNNNLINIKSSKTILDDDNIIRIEKYSDDKLILVLKEKDQVLYDIKTKKILSIPLNYYLDSILFDNIYVLKDKKNNTMLIDSNGYNLLEDVNIKIYSFENKLVLVYPDKIIAACENIKTIPKDKYCLAPLIYQDGKIILIRKRGIKLYDLDFNLIKNIKLNNLSEIEETTIFEDCLKITYKNTKQVLVNLQNNKIIRHDNIDKINNWYVGYQGNKYYFYDDNLDLIRSIKTNNFKFLYGDLVKIRENQILNIKTGELIKTEYQNICFFKNKDYGLASKKNSEIIDIIDSTIKPISRIDNKKYDLDIDNSYYLLNNKYIAIFDYTLKRQELKINRLFIKKLDGLVFLDSLDYQLEVIGKYFKIYNDDKCIYLDTKTGETGILNMRKPKKNKKFSVEKHLILKKDSIK